MGLLDLSTRVLNNSEQILEKGFVFFSFLLRRLLSISLKKQLFSPVWHAPEPFCSIDKTRASLSQSNLISLRIWVLPLVAPFLQISDLDRLQ